MVLGWIVGRRDGKVWTRCIWLGAGTGGEF
jgi:hypothetical protein